MLEDRAAYWAAIELHDRAGALEVVERLLDAGMSPCTIIEAVVVPAQARVGDLWLADVVSISGEHAATAINESVVQWLGARRQPTPPDGRPVLVACVDPEEHTLAALVVAEHLFEAGWAATLVPGTTTADDLLAAVERLGVRAVLLSATLTSSLAALRGALVELGSLGVPVVVGGRAWGGEAQRALRLGATAWCATAGDALAELEALPERLAVKPVGRPSAMELEADELMRRRFTISGHLASRLFQETAGSDARPSDWWPDLESQLDQLVGCLASSLVTEDPLILVEVRDWLADVIAARNGPPDVAALAWELFVDTIAACDPGVPAALATVRAV